MEGPATKQIILMEFPLKSTGALLYGLILGVPSNQDVNEYPNLNDGGSIKMFSEASLSYTTPLSSRSPGY